MKAAYADAEQKKMKEYACEKCGKDFDQKSHYDAHMKKKKPCVNDSILEKRLEGLLQKIEPVVAAVLPQKTNDKMAEVIKTKEEQHKFFELLHNLLWNDAGLNPEKALEHMTFFFAYRLIEQQADALGLPQECRWSYLANIKDKQILFEEMRKGIIAFNKNKKTKPFFKPHEIKKIDTLYNIVQEINKLDIVSLQETDTLGDIFEYMLARGMSTMSDEGQYFTMRAICKLAFKLSYSVKQRVRRDDGSLMTFADFFCGTGGFPAEFVKGVNQVEGKKTNWSKDCESIYCLDKNVSSVMTTLLNMLILTGIPFSDKKIREYNSFQDNISKGHNAVFKDLLVDYCFMNPPYGGDKTKAKDYKFKYAVFDKETKMKHYRVNEDIQSIGIEEDDKVSAGVQLAMATLAPEGVCSIVLPQGFFFGASKKLIELRKRLAEEYKIHYVADFAAGVFKNTNTKTAMMVFQRGVGRTENVKFIDIDENILVDASLEELRSKNYSLDYKQYLSQTAVEVEGFEMINLGDIIEKIKSGKTNSTEISNSGDYDFYGCTAKVPTGKHNKYDFEGDEYLLFAKSGGNAKTKVGENLGIGKFHYVTGKTAGNIAVYQYKIRDTNKVLYKYLYYLLRSRLSEIQMLADYTTGNGNINIENMYTKIILPIPSIEHQKEIVGAIDYYSQLAHSEEQSLKLLEKVVMGWVKELGRGKERVKLGEVCEFQRGKMITKKDLIDGEFPVIGGGLSPMGYHNVSNRKEYIPLISQSGENAGHISRYTKKVWASDCFSITSTKMNDDFLYYSLLHIQDDINFLKTGTAQPHIYPSSINSLTIAMPSIAEQETLQSDFDEIKHKHRKIAEYKAKAQDAINRLIPGANNNKILEASEKQQTKSESPESVASEPSPQKEKKTRGPSKIKTRPSSKE